MTYNLHPIFVHFPIALLFIYSIIRVLPLQKWFPGVAWKQAERILLFLGVLGAFVALTTGETAEELMRANSQLVEAHSTFAAISTWLYVALLAGEVSSYLSVKYHKAIIVLLKKILAEGWFPKVMALVALVSISLTGLLGGVIVYGPTADPFAAFVLKLLGITL
ncbi:MAG: DUF2231 domain-containing protein [Candidatus Paceibacterota bacterium]|jgi:uncharacterized membrane protein